MKCHYCKRPGIHTYDIGIIISVCTVHIKKAKDKERLYLKAEAERIRNEALNSLKTKGQNGRNNLHY